MIETYAESRTSYSVIHVWLIYQFSCQPDI